MRRARQGVAAVEFALIASILVLMVVNAFDVGIYFYTAMQVDNAAEMGVQAAWQTCDPSKTPATVQCPELATAVQAAVSSTTLGSRVRLDNGYPREGYYCLDGATGQLQYMADVYHKPNDCRDASNPTVKPGDYIQVQVTYLYRASFPLSIANFFASPIVRSAMMRLV